MLRRVLCLGSDIIVVLSGGFSAALIFWVGRAITSSYNINDIISNGTFHENSFILIYHIHYKTVINPVNSIKVFQRMLSFISRWKTKMFQKSSVV